MELAVKLDTFFKRSSISITIGLGFLKIIKAVLALVIIILSAKYFGASPERDAWLIGITIITVFTQLFFGPINETFITKYIHLREAGEDAEVKKATNSLISIIIILSLVISFIVYLFSTNLAGIFAPGFSPEQRKSLIIMINLLIPSLVMLEVVNIWSSILNAFKSYFIPDLFSFISLTLNIVLIVFLSPSIGIYSLVISSYTSTILLLIILYRELKYKYAYTFKPIIPDLQLVKPFFLFALPLYVNYLFSQADTVIERNIISTKGTGSVSMLDYARKFTELPTGLMISIVTTVLTPIISLYAVKNTDKILIDETQKYFRFTVLLILPLSIMLIVTPLEIVNLILVHGKFSKEYAEPTSALLTWYGYGLFTVIFYIIYTQLVISQKKVILFSKVVIITYIVKISFNLFFNNLLGLNTFPISAAFSNFIMGLILMYYGLKEFREKMLSDAFYMIILFSLTLAGSHLFYTYIISYVYNRTAIISSVLLVTILLEGILICILNIEESRIIKRYLFPA